MMCRQRTKDERSEQAARSCGTFLPDARGAGSMAENPGAKPTHPIEAR
jgi:hypothetical protein